MTVARYDFVLHTWGCKVNTYDTGLLEARLKSETMPGLPRVHILNTCAVTETASREAARQVRRIKAKEPLSKIVVTGCGAQVDGGIFDTLPGADLIVANSHKGQIEDLIDKLFNGTLESKVFRSNIFLKHELEEGGGLESDHTRSFLKIQDGCNSFCSYCVIPFARGKSRSIPVHRLVKRINELEKSGAREVVITGVHIADYEDVDSTSGKIHHLDDLIEILLRETTIPRIRISSLEPTELSPRLLELFEKDSRLCRHFHLSIQSANTQTLVRMRRRYTADDVERIFNEIQTRLPTAFVGLDLIVGFPGETEEEFQETYEMLRRTPWTRIHVFPYSERPGTKALNLENSVPLQVRNSRAALIRTLSSERYRIHAENVTGTTAEGLVLKKSLDQSYQTITREYWPVRINSDVLATGEEIKIKLLRYVRPEAGGLDGWFEGEVARC